MQLGVEAPSDQCFVYRDLENLESVRFGTPIPTLLVNLADDVRRSLQSHGGWVQALAVFVEEVRAAKRQATLNGFDDALRLVLNNKKNRGLTLVLVLDEIEHLLPFDMKSIPVGAAQDDIARFFGILRAQWQSHDNFVFILAGVTASAFEHSEMYGRSNPLFKIADPTWLASLKADESAELLTSIGRRQGMEWNEDACRLAVRESGGHPLLLRQIGSAVFSQFPVDRLVTEVVSDNQVRARLGEYAKASVTVVGEMIDHMRKFYPDDFEMLKVLNDGLPLADALELSPHSIDRLERLGLIGLRGKLWNPTPLLSLATQFSTPRVRHKDRWPSLDEMLLSGETDDVEFKSTFAIDLQNKGVPTEKIQWSCIRAILSFLNSRGGTLLIGVADDGSLLGLEADIRLKGNRDIFVRTVNAAIRDYIGSGIHSACDVDFVTSSNKGETILQIHVPKWSEPVFMPRSHKGGGDPNRLYVRNHAQTSELGGHDLMQYINQHWGSTQ